MSIVETLNNAAFQLAQVNIARMLAPLDDPIMADFVANLDGINRLAEGTPGFIWRLKDSDGNATALRVFDDLMLIINMSVWDSIESLHQYAYYSDHAKVYRRRTEWFSRMDTPSVALWWVSNGQMPTPQDAKDRLEYMHTHGSTPYTFTFKQPFTAGQAADYLMVAR